MPGGRHIKEKRRHFNRERALRLHQSIKILNVKGKPRSGGRKDCSFANMPLRLSTHMNMLSKDGLPTSVFVSQHVSYGRGVLHRVILPRS